MVSICSFIAHIWYILNNELNVNQQRYSDAMLSALRLFIRPILSPPEKRLSCEENDVYCNATRIHLTAVGGE